jgi:hypothetical protein
MWQTPDYSILILLQSLHQIFFWCGRGSIGKGAELRASKELYNLSHTSSQNFFTYTLFFRNITVLTPFKNYIPMALNLYLQLKYLS